MKVVRATDRDISGWLILAAEVESSMGSLVSNPDFYHSLAAAIDDGTALCIRENDDPPGSPLSGGMLYSVMNGTWRINWLAVAQAARNQGVGSLLLGRLFEEGGDRTVWVATFGPGDPGGVPARNFYEKHGFAPAEMLAAGAAPGITKQAFRRRKSRP